MHQPPQYGRSWDRVTNGTVLAFLPPKLSQDWASLFVQDEITLTEALRLTLGARLENNDYTGNEVLPNARLSWKLAPDHLLWTAASRAVRSPSRLDHDVYVPGEPPYTLGGGPGVQSEVAKVYELGYRGQPTRQTSLDATVRHVSALTQPQVAAYTLVDLRGAWQLRPGLELPLAVNNLFDREHSEFEYLAPYRSEFGRSAYLKLTSRF